MTADVEVGLIAAFAADAPLNALIGGRVYPNELPESPTLPAVVYQVISAPRSYTQDGDAGVAMTRFQLHIHADTYADVRSVKNALLAAYSGTAAQAFGSPAIYLGGWFFEGEQDVFSDDLGVEGARHPVKLLDVVIHACDRA